MKIIHTADLHIDSPLTSKLPADKGRERRAELLSNLSRLVNEARRLGACAIIIAGDLFDSADVRKTAKAALRDTVKGAADIAFFYLPGNHDADIIDELYLSELGNFYTFPKDNWKCYGLGDDITLTGRGECSADMFDTLILDKQKKNIVLLHGELRERSASPHTVGINDAAQRHIDYLALGHYHSYSETLIDRRGVAVYSGTPEGRGFDETGECGFVLIDTDKGMSHKFISFAKRRTHIIPLDLSNAKGSHDILESAGRVLAPIPECDIVRLELCGSYSVGLWRDTANIERLFADRFYYFEIKDSSHISVNAEDYKNDKSLKGEFIRLILADGTLSPKEKEKIIACGINALMGEEYSG